MKGHQIQSSISKIEESPCSVVSAARRSKDISMKKPLKISGKSLNRDFYEASLDSPSDINKGSSSSSMVSEILDSDQGKQITENSVLELNQTLSGLTEETRTTPISTPPSKMTLVSDESGTVLSAVKFADADGTILAVDALVNEVVARLCCLPEEEEEKHLVIATKWRVALYCFILWSFALAVALRLTMDSGAHRSYRGLPPT